MDEYRIIDYNRMATYEYIIFVIGIFVRYRNICNFFQLVEYGSTNQKVPKDKENSRYIKVAYNITYCWAFLMGTLRNCERGHSHCSSKCDWCYFKFKPNPFVSQAEI